VNTIASILLLAASTPLVGQWLNYRDSSIPRTRDGKPNLSAAAPRASNRKPDLSGIWQTEATPADEMRRIFGDVNALSVPGDDPLTFSKYFLSVLADFKPEESPLRPEAAGQFQRLTANRGKESPTINCLPPGLSQADLGPFPYKIIQTPGLIVILYESFSGHRQIYLDGRKPPPDPEPLWLGYSAGKWDGDTLAVDTVGFNTKSWLDAFGHPHSEDLHVIERFRRRDFGHMDVQLTIEDLKAYSRPFTVKFTDLLVPDSDVGENFCAENEKDRTHIPGK
jgi:hypothetical protein